MPRRPTPRDEYLVRIHRAQDHIERGLAGPLRLEDVARAAAFSPFHFSRLYAAVTGETLRAFVLRLRLERAAVRLKLHPDRSVTGIALDCGFGSPAAFARAFRASFGTSASEWRKRGKAIRKPGKAERKPGKAPARARAYAAAMIDPGHEVKAGEVTVEARPALTVAYVRHVGPYAGDEALFGRLFGKVTRWAAPRGLLGPGARLLTVSHDDPHVTEDEKQRITCGLVVPAGTRGSGEIGVMELPAATTAVARFELETAEFPAAWDWVFGRWLPESGYQPADALPYEEYVAHPEDHPRGKHVVDICLPVVPL